MSTVWVVGSINVDLVVEVARLPRPGETVHGSRLDRSQGGKGANQAAAAARLGAPTRLIGRVGDDDTGPWLRDQLGSFGVDVSAVATVPGPSGTAVVVVDRAGDNSIVVVEGANDAFGPEAVDALTPAPGDVVVTQNEIRLDVTAAAIERARSAGATSICNPAPATPAIGELARQADVLVVNETELATLSCRDVGVDDPTEVIVSAAGEIRRDAPVVVTLGARGVVAVVDREVVEIPAIDVDVVDTTGAGDAFVGAIARRLAIGDTLVGALDHAVVVSAIVVGRRGAGPAMPSEAEVASLMAERRTR